MFRCNNEMRFDGPCQDAGEGFGFREESKVVAPTWHAYCFEFGVPCDCSQGFTAAGHFPQTSSVVVLFLDSSSDAHQLADLRNERVEGRFTSLDGPMDELTVPRTFVVGFITSSLASYIGGFRPLFAHSVPLSCAYLVYRWSSSERRHG